jgi:hypothetical protein
MFFGMGEYLYGLEFTRMDPGTNGMWLSKGRGIGSYDGIEKISLNSSSRVCNPVSVEEWLV